MERGEKNKKSKKGQVWVETVIYTLIALALIGLVLSFVKPKIEEIKDRAIIEQSIVIMENIDSMINSIDEGGHGNRRLVELVISKGALKIDGEKNIIVFEINSEYAYSQPGTDVAFGDLIVNTQKVSGGNKVTLTRDYSNRYNITYQEKDQLKTINPASTPYQLFISNKDLGGGNSVIDFEFG